MFGTGGGFTFTGHEGLAVDSADNPFVVVNSQMSGSDWDAQIIKLDRATGATRWTGILGGNSSDTRGNGITVDAQGHIYVTDGFSNTADLDPTAGVQLRTAIAGNWDSYLVKLDSPVTVGDFVVLDYIGSPSTTANRVIKVNPVTGAQALISQGGYLDSPQAVGGERIARRWGSIIVANAQTDAASCTDRADQPGQRRPMRPLRGRLAQLDGRNGY